MEKNGVFSRVRSRWRSIFSKKSNPVKLRDCNRLTFERILSDPDEQIGTILAQATVEPITLPNGGGIALIQETTVYEEEPIASKKEKPKKNSNRRFRRLSSGDLNVIRRMTEEIDFDLKNVIYDGNEITGEPDEENGIERACFKPGPEYPTNHQMMFLKQCLKKVDTRPPNMYYLTNGWTVDNFEAFFKYMIRSGEDCSRESLLRIEFRNCVVTLEYLRQFIEEYAAFKGVSVETDYVYAVIHSKKLSVERKLRGAIAPFVEVESKVRKARISYTSTFVINSPHTPNVTIIVRFCCSKPCKFEKGKKRVQIMVTVDHVTGHSRMAMNEAQRRVDGISCGCTDRGAGHSHISKKRAHPITTIVTDREMLIDDEEVPLQLSYNMEDEEETKPTNEHLDNDQTDITSETAGECDVREYTDMFPILFDLFDRAGIRENENEKKDSIASSSTEFPKKKMSRVTMSSDGKGNETCEDTHSISSSASELSSTSSSSSRACSSSESDGSSSSDSSDDGEEPIKKH